MSDLSNITVNGVPLSNVIREADRAERMSCDEKEISRMRVIARPHYATSGIRNHSGCKSGPVRVLYSAAAAGSL